MALADRIVAKLKVQARALDEDELVAYLGVIRQAVNQACRLEREGIVGGRRRLRQAGRR